MKTLKMKQLDEKDEEIADALISLGLGRNVAMTLAYMQNTNAATTIELERSARLRQPEVSIAMKQLKERDWVNEREEKKPGKGRPNKIYSLRSSIRNRCFYRRCRFYSLYADKVFHLDFIESNDMSYKSGFYSPSLFSG